MSRFIEDAMIEASGSVSQHLERFYYPEGCNLKTAAAPIGFDKRTLHAFLVRRGFPTKAQSECQRGELNGFYGKSHGAESRAVIGGTSAARQSVLARSNVNGRYGSDQTIYVGEASAAYINGIRLYRALALEHYGESCMLCGTAVGLEVHHRDGNRTHNKLSNLSVLCGSCHRSYHARLRKKREVKGQC